MDAAAITAFIDTVLRDRIGDRNLVPASEVRDFLLDLRLLATASADDVEDFLKGNPS